MDPLTTTAAVVGLAGLLIFATLYPELFDGVPKVLLWGVLIAIIGGVVYEVDHLHIIQRIIARSNQETLDAIGSDLQKDVRSIDWLQWPLLAFVAYLGLLLAVGVAGRRRGARKSSRQPIPQRR